MGGSRIGHSSFASLIAAAALIACSRPAKVERHQLPGFSIELTTGTMVGPEGSSTSDYARGTLAIRDDAHERLSMIAWTPGEKLSREELAPVIVALGVALHTTATGTVVSDTGADGSKVDTMVVDTDLAPLRMTQLPCGGRNLLLATMSEHDAAAFHHQLLTSIVCTPDPAQETQLGTVTLELRRDLPSWKTMSHDDGQLVLTDGHSLLLLRPMPVGTSDELVSAVGPMLTAMFGKEITVGAQVDGRVPLEGTIEGERFIGWAKLAPCPHSKTMALALATSSAGADGLAAVLDRATCAPEGAPPQVWPATAPPK